MQNLWSVANGSRGGCTRPGPHRCGQKPFANLQMSLLVPHCGLTEKLLADLHHDGGAHLYEMEGVLLGQEDRLLQGHIDRMGRPHAVGADPFLAGRSRLGVLYHARPLENHRADRNHQVLADLCLEIHHSGSLCRAQSGHREARDSGSNFDFVIGPSSFFHCYCHHHHFERRVAIWNDFGGFCFGCDFLVVSRAREEASEIDSAAVAADPPPPEVPPHLLRRAKGGWTW
mmetsp:Transcript_8436/g.24156  ORF Transcript_8436/g.24156 Transcript_8436/m.24156 type:complete len:229 (+) Transcript_8436:880-1566(+)